MGRGMNSIKNVFRAAAVAGIVIFLVFAAGCSGDLLGYIKDMIAQGERKGVIDLPRTGQNSSYATGDDGYYRMGVAWPDSRFTDNLNGTITDNLTGLIWLKDGNLFGINNTWAQALFLCNNLAADGTDLKDGSNAGDWRLPNRKELRSLVNYGQLNTTGWLNGQGFTGVQDGYYWSSTTYAPGTDEAWDVNMSDGSVVYDATTGVHYMLAVRSGQAGGTVSLPKTGQATSDYTGDDGDLEKGVAWPVPRFTDNLNGTITDNLTGLMWDRSGDTFSGQKTWIDALIDCNGLGLGGYDDWRLPNVNELESLINAGQTEPAAWLNAQGFSGVQNGFYWASTTCALDTDYAWYVFMFYGTVLNAPKTEDYYVLAVRSGQ